MVAAAETELTAKESKDVAKRRVEKGASPISDALQAETAYVQARVNKTKTEGDWQNAVGTLAADMVLSPDTPLRLPDVDDGVKADETFRTSAAALIEEAMTRNPSIRAAEAEMKAAQAEIRRTEAEGLPSLSITGKSSHSDQPSSQGLGFPWYRANQQNNYVGLQVSFPLFEGFTREYKILAAEAKMEEQKLVLEETLGAKSVSAYGPAIKPCRSRPRTYRTAPNSFRRRSNPMRRPGTAIKPELAVSSNF